MIRGFWSRNGCESDQKPNPPAENSQFGYHSIIRIISGIFEDTVMTFSFRSALLGALPVLLLFPLVARAQLGPDSLRFALMSDPQYADKASTTDRCYRNTIPKMDSAVKFLNTQSPAFLLILGDYVDAYTNAVADTTKTYRDIDTLNKSVAKFAGPIYQVLGNHDEASLNKSEWLARAVGSVKKNYYAFDAGPFHFIVMDGNYSPDGKDFGRIDPWVWNSVKIPQSQIDWLSANLDSAGQKPTIVSIHENLSDATEYSVSNAAAIRTVLQTHGNVTHVLQGHRHEGGYVKVGGIHYYTHKAMCNCPAGATSTGNNFSLVTLKDSAMYIDGYYGTRDTVLASAGIKKAAWPASVRYREAELEKRVRFTADAVELIGEDAHSVRVQGADGRQVRVRRGVGVRHYSLNDLMGSAPGVYLLTVHTDRGSVTRKSVRF
jgi:UDP-2,3-diacylglucosamine pyrophosphatase LpxH